jgi:uncharacterized repeat protein (TIGR02543 family)
VKFSASKVSVLLVVVFLSSSLFLVQVASAQSYYPLSQNALTVTVNYPQAGYVFPGSGTYYYGSTVTARVYTNQGYVFDGWYLNGVYQGKLTTIPITMTQDYTLVATFSIRTVCLTITNNPDQGGTTTPSTGIWNYTYGSQITVKEYPTAGCNFSGWYLDGVYEGLGTSITVPMNQDRQLGAFFAGNIPAPTTPPEPSVTPQPTESPSYLPVPNLSFYCTSSTTTSGFRVQIQGALVYNLTGLSGSGITFSYSANGGSTWHDLAYLITGDDGVFSAVWMPSASGNYVVKGVWLGDDAYARTSSTVNFAVAPSENQAENVFSVSSNSTLSSLVFDSTKNQLSFTVSGPSGTSGYLQACIPKTLIPVVANLRVTLDGVDVPYQTFSQGSVWLITIQYSHSSHSVIMSLNDQDYIPPTQAGQTIEPQGLPTVTILTAVVVALVVIAIGSVTIVFKQRKRLKTVPHTK